MLKNGSIDEQWDKENIGTIDLRQEHKPEILSADFFPRTILPLRSNKHFICRAKGQPKPTVEWIVSDRVVGKYGGDPIQSAAYDYEISTLRIGNASDLVYFLSNQTDPIEFPD